MLTAAACSPPILSVHPGALVAVAGTAAGVAAIDAAAQVTSRWAVLDKGTPVHAAHLHSKLSHFRLPRSLDEGLALVDQLWGHRW